MDVEIEFFPRKAQNRGETKALRRDGKVPCVLYSKGQIGQNGYVTKEAIDTVLREVETGFLPTTTFSIKDANGKKTRGIIKSIDYAVTTYDVLHIDFLELADDQMIDVKVPVVCTSQAECVGVKAGGFLRQTKQHIEVRCLPRNMPKFFEVDVKDVDIRQVKRVSDINIPKDVRPLIKPQDVVVTVVK
jgi:large subunit ribosomal protein L25